MAHQRPAMIRTDSSNSFANNTIRVRLPKIIREIGQLNPDYPDTIRTALLQLSDDLQLDAPIPMLSLPAPDYDDWLVLYTNHATETWQTSVWYFAEHYFYRLVIEAVRWWELWRDPFLPNKNAEINGDALWQTLDVAVSTPHEPTEERLAQLIHHMLWGNRIDLSFPTAMAHGSQVQQDDLLLDDTTQAVEQILAHRGSVHIVADNAGTELTMDLVFIDALLDGVSDNVVLHLKLHPTFVSDATVPDVLTFLAILTSGKRGAEAANLGQRLHNALIAGRLRLAPDGFWNSPRLLSDLPPRLESLFAGATLVVSKGDANYRRVVDDAIWNPATPFADVTDYFAAPLLAVRTLKSDPIVGLPEGKAEQLDAIDAEWRVNGKRGVIQFKG